MREPTGDRAQGPTPPTTPAALVVRVEDTALQGGTAGIDVLTRNSQTKHIKVAEGRKIGRTEGNVRQVEVLQMVSVRTSILGDLDPNPRPLTPRSAHPRLRRAG